MFSVQDYISGSAQEFRQTFDETPITETRKAVYQDSNIQIPAIVTAKARLAPNLYKQPRSKGM